MRLRLREGSDERICRAITSSGHRCKNKAVSGSDFCGIAAHQRLAELIEEGSEEIEVVTPIAEPEVPSQPETTEDERNADSVSEEDVPAEQLMAGDAGEELEAENSQTADELEATKAETDRVESDAGSMVEEVPEESVGEDSEPAQEEP